MLGSIIHIIRYASTGYRVVVPEKNVIKHSTHIKQFRKDLLDSKGLLVQKGSDIAKQVGVEDKGTIYENLEGKQLVIPSNDWQLEVEMEYGFTTLKRWDNAPKIPQHQMLEAVSDNEWIFAKTMPSNPHFYALRSEWNADSGVSFDAFVLVIRGKGYTNVFNERKYRQLDIGNYSYWTMGAPLTITILINRKEII